MAIQFVHRIKTESNYSDGDRQYVAVWHVRTTDPLDQAATVSTAVDPTTGEHVPAYLEPFAVGNDLDSYSLCRRVRASYKDRDHSKLDWLVVAEYAARGAPPDEPSDPTQPWTRRTKWRIQQSDYSEIVSKDINDVDVLNSAHQKYDPPLERDAGKTIIDLVYYKQQLDLSVLDEYRYALNDAQFWGYGPGKLRINLLEADEEYENGLYYWAIHAQLESSDDWTGVILDEGMLIKDGSDYKLPKDADDYAHTVPILLDGSGGALSPTGTAQYGFWDIYEEKDFTSSALGLPQSLPSHLTI